MSHPHPRSETRRIVLALLTSCAGRVYPTPELEVLSSSAPSLPSLLFLLSTWLYCRIRGSPVCRCCLSLLDFQGISNKSHFEGQLINRIANSMQLLHSTSGQDVYLLPTPSVILCIYNSGRDLKHLTFALGSLALLHWFASQTHDVLRSVLQ